MGVTRDAHAEPLNHGRAPVLNDSRRGTGRPLVPSALWVRHRGSATAGSAQPTRNRDQRDHAQHGRRTGRHPVVGQSQMTRYQAPHLERAYTAGIRRSTHAPASSITKSDPIAAR
jgi:hypothetical protein